MKQKFLFLFITLIVIFILAGCSDHDYKSKFEAVCVIEGYDPITGERSPQDDEYVIYDGKGFLWFDENPLDPDVRRVGYFVEKEVDIEKVSVLSKTESDLVMEELRSHWGKFVRKTQVKYK